MSGHYALYLFYEVGISLPEYENCKIDHAGFFVTKMALAFSFPKTSPYREVFNYALQRMKESGEMDKIERKHKLDARTCGGGGKGRTLGFKNIILVFCILGFGLLVSVVSFLVEIVIKLCK